MMDALLSGMDQLFTLSTMIAMLLGVIAGVIASAIPGFTITMAIVLTLPLTFTMDPLQGVATMLAVYVGGYTGGLISAALLGIPGTPSSISLRASSPRVSPQIGRCGVSPLCMARASRAKSRPT